MLIALFSEAHIHHEAALARFLAHRRRGWATCALSELAFVRISMQAFGQTTALTFADAQRTVRLNVAAKDQEFLPLAYSPAEILSEIQERVRGQQQLTDALLLDLALRHNGKPATFDRRIINLLPAGSAHRAAIEIINAA